MAITQEDLQAIRLLMREEIQKGIQEGTQPIKSEISEVKEQIQPIKSEISEVKEQIQPIKSEISEVKEQIQPIKSEISEIKEQLMIHTRSITRLENSVMHELKLLNENLPNTIARSEKVEELDSKVENHDHRIFALEQAANQ